MEAVGRWFCFLVPQSKLLPKSPLLDIQPSRTFQVNHIFFFCPEFQFYLWLIEKGNVWAESHSWDRILKIKKKNLRPRYMACLRSQSQGYKTQGWWRGPGPSALPEWTKAEQLRTAWQPCKPWLAKQRAFTQRWLCAWRPLAPSTGRTCYVLRCQPRANGRTPLNDGAMATLSRCGRGCNQCLC